MVCPFKQKCENLLPPVCKLPTQSNYQYPISSGWVGLNTCHKPLKWFVVVSPKQSYYLNENIRRMWTCHTNWRTKVYPYRKIQTNTQPSHTLTHTMRGNIFEADEQTIKIIPKMAKPEIIHYPVFAPHCIWNEVFSPFASRQEGNKYLDSFTHLGWVHIPWSFFLGWGEGMAVSPSQLTLLTNGCKTLVMSLSHIFYFTFNLLKSEVFTHLDDWTRTNVTFWQLSFDMAWHRVAFEWTKVWICQQLFITLSVVMSE